MTKEEQAQKIAAQEKKARRLFINWFSDKVFVSIAKNPNLTDHYDLVCVDKNSKKYLVGLKIRDFKLKTYCNGYNSGFFIEEAKIDFFKECRIGMPNMICLYFNFLNDGYICFNITNRIIETEKNHSSTILETYGRWLPNETIGDNSLEWKMVNELRPNRNGDGTTINYGDYVNDFTIEL
jgi:hypothetical protein